jgi:hypothetical protein
MSPSLSWDLVTGDVGVGTVEEGVGAVGVGGVNGIRFEEYYVTLSIYFGTMRKPNGNLKFPL